MKKRRKRRIRIKKSNTVKISLTIFIIALGLYLIFYYSEKEEKPVEIESPAEITPEIPIKIPETTKASTLISDLKCVDGNIMMTFTNILRYPKDISDFSFFVGGKLNRNPGCELTHLEPGESTFCNNLNAGITFKKKVLITVAYPAHYEKAVVDCGKVSITGNIIKDIKQWFIKLFNLS